jgi:16S rRNA (cytidine1402-2'-O)-methyltransferase
MSGTLFVVATPIGNLEDITARALRVLREVNLIAAEDTRRTGHLLARYAIETPTTSYHQHNEQGKLAAVLERLKQGESIALVSDAGTPTLSDPGQMLVQAAIEAGIRVEPIPGANAPMAALAASGIDGKCFTFLGFPPIKSKDRNLWFDRLLKAAGPVVFFEAPHRIGSTLEQIQRLAGDRYVSVARELTKNHEEFVRGPISSVIAKLLNPIGEFTVVLDVARTPEVPISPPSPQELVSAFGRMTERSGYTRRRAIAELARTYGLAPNDVYAALEAAKTSA